VSLGNQLYPKGYYTFSTNFTPLVEEDWESGLNTTMENTTHPNYPEIQRFYEAGIIDGSGINMDQEMNLTRAQLAKILVNTFGLEMGENPVEFKDINPTSVLSKYIQILASNGISVGYNGNYMPNESITREHFSLFLLRTIEMTKK
jgi:hypothetical protein